MKAHATVYLNADRSAAVPDGDASARFLLVRSGCEISQSEAHRYAGAIELIGGTKKADTGVQSRDPATEARDPEVSQPRRGRPPNERTS